MDRAAGLVEHRMIRSEVSGSGCDAAEWLGGLARHRHGHPVGFKSGAADQKRVGMLPEFEQAGVVLVGGPTGWMAGGGSDFPSAEIARLVEIQGRCMADSGRGRRSAQGCLWCFASILPLPKRLERFMGGPVPLRIFLAMTFEIFLTLLVIVLTLVAFIREWAAPDVLALSILCLVVALGWWIRGR